jgi:hypothetical protein
VIDRPSFTAGMEYFLAEFSDLIARDPGAMNRARTDVLRGREGKQPPRLIRLHNVWVLWREEAQRALDAYSSHPRLTKPPVPPYGHGAGNVPRREVEWHDPE